jgi:hypothetical protein
MPPTQLDPLHSRAEIGILACSKCGNPMRLSQIEPRLVMMCALSNARSAIPACAFMLLSKRESYAVLDKRYLRVVASDTRERGRFVFTAQSLIRAQFSDYFHGLSELF